ncbi:MAG: hypothetical protein RL063_1618 [Pseudomonadota bacterium]|jgi:iron complex outermembrane receptor protein
MSSPSTFQRTLLSIAVLSACGISQNVIAAEDTINIMNTAPVVVTATRVETNSFDLPVSIDVVGSESIHDGQSAMNLSESLIRVPGLTAQNRTQMAQDPQISTRGFGARSAFGVRGVRILVDGIPLTMPDGIGQPGNVDLEAIKAIEVMRGPFSSLYGSSSGGIIQLITADAPKSPEVGFSFMAGSYGTTKESTNATGTVNGVEYLLNINHFETDGYRQHSAAWKDQQTAQIKFDISDSTRVNILANAFKSEAQDPLGLAGFDGADGYSGSTFGKCTSGCTSNKYSNVFTNPTAVPDAAILANTRVSRSNTQIGTNIEHKLDENNNLNFIGSIGHRNNDQFLALPILPTTTGSTTGTVYYPSLTPGSYGDLSRGRESKISRDFWNTEFNWTNKGVVFSKTYSVTTGIAYSSLTDNRSDINASGGIALPSSTTGTKLLNTVSSDNVINNINRHENDTAHNFDQFIQGKLGLTDSVDLHAGMRHTKVSVNFEGLPDSASTITGSASFSKTTPVIGAIWKATPATNFYANYGQGFETPTTIEMAYNNKLNPTGPNLDLKPSTSDNYEIGVKSYVSDNTRLKLAIFKTNTTNEIIISSNATYSVYGNSTTTSRQGVEFTADSQLSHNLALYGAYTYLDAKFDSAYTSGIGKALVQAGNVIPGTYKQQLYGEISWKYPELNFKTALEGRSNSKVFVNDLNLEAAPGYTVFNIRGGFEQKISNWMLSEYLRVENIMDKSYIGAVRINDNSNRNYEAAAGRNWMMGLSASYRF